MQDERLLERIGSVDREPRRRNGDDRGLRIDSVLSHLQRILNTRQGNVPVAGDYGIPDFLDLLQSYPESLQEIEHSIKNAIDRYEPRLSGAAVTFVPDEEGALALRFRIVAGLTPEGGAKVFFETIVDTDGRILIHK